jgi:hypothetical protein
MGAKELVASKNKECPLAVGKGIVAVDPSSSFSSNLLIEGVGASSDWALLDERWKIELSHNRVDGARWANRMMIHIELEAEGFIPFNTEGIAWC